MAAKTLYKCLVRDAKELGKIQAFHLRSPLEVEQWGIGYPLQLPTSGAHANVQSISSLEEIYELRENGGFNHKTGDIDLVRCIQRAFRQNASLSDPKMISDKLDEAMQAMHELSDQRRLANATTVTTTEGLRIEATSQYIPEFSVPENDNYRFTYRMTITNENPTDSVHISGRQFTFESVKGFRRSLPRHSPGIVGHTPTLLPGQTFQYASGVDIDAPLGSVQGCLHAIRTPKDGDDSQSMEFDAVVSKFPLIATQVET